MKQTGLVDKGRAGGFFHLDFNKAVSHGLDEDSQMDFCATKPLWRPAASRASKGWFCVHFAQCGQDGGAESDLSEFAG